MDDFDLLEATLDPNDFVSKLKVRKLQLDLEYEETKLTVKAVVAFAMESDDPMRIKGE